MRREPCRRLFSWRKSSRASVLERVQLQIRQSNCRVLPLIFLVELALPRVHVQLFIFKLLLKNLVLVFLRIEVSELIRISEARLAVVTLGRHRRRPHSLELKICLRISAWLHGHLAFNFVESACQELVGDLFILDKLLELPLPPRAQLFVSACFISSLADAGLLAARGPTFSARRVERPSWIPRTRPFLSLTRSSSVRVPSSVHNLLVRGTLPQILPRRGVVSLGWVVRNGRFPPDRVPFLFAPDFLVTFWPGFIDLHSWIFVHGWLLLDSYRLFLRLHRVHHA